MKMKLLEICQRLPDIDVSEFWSFTSKWIDYAKSDINSSSIPETDWNQLFSQTNPVAGIDRGEMQDRIKQKNGYRETNERRSFVYNWNSIFLPIIKDIVNPNSENRIEKIKKVRDTMRSIIVQGGGRKTKAAINRMLITFCPDILIRIPNEDKTKEFIKLLKPFSDSENPLIIQEDWVDNSIHIMEFLKKQLGELTKKRTLWDVYVYLKESDIEKENKNMFDKFIFLLETNKNLILTGAPGTGKTYLAKEIAKAMGCIDEEIGFVQFHPSYDYTDFVEGLRPFSDGKGNLGFERKDGVFKEFCKLSKKTRENNTKSIFDITFDALCDDIKDGKIVNVPLKSKKESTRLSTNGPDMIKWDAPNTGDISSNAVSRERLKKLYNEYRTLDGLMKIENINDSIRKVIGGCNTSMYYAVLQEILKRIDTSNEVISELSRDYKKPKLDIGKTNKKFVFIIDEINRGEISKIFGELFLSIDPGYRGEYDRNGNDNKVQTQYQNLIPKEGDKDFDPQNADIFRYGFYVPENVFIIGTMNDIDRSVESMDFAMRRRFAWQEVTAEESYANMIENDPDYALFKDEIKQRMFSLNKAIAETEGLDEAYQIGAAYFRKYLDYQDKDNPFECLWNNHLKGLLFEYLRGNRRAKELLEKLHNAYNKTNLDE